jgi:hypothetical protein
MNARRLRQLALSTVGAALISGTSYAICIHRPLVQINQVPSGVSITVSQTVPFTPWVIERTETLEAGTNTAWVALSTNSTSAGGTFIYIDTNAPASGCFYRVRHTLTGTETQCP